MRSLSRTAPPGGAAFREGMAAREAALGLADDTHAQRITRAERAMAQAFWNLDMAERRHQPAQVLDQLEARYFTALHAYEHEVKHEMRGGGRA